MHSSLCVAAAAEGLGCPSLSVSLSHLIDKHELGIACMPGTGEAGMQLRTC